MTKVPRGRTTAQISRRQKARSLPGCRGVQTHRFPITVALVRQPVDEPGVDGPGLVDRIQLTVFPVITGQTGDDPIFLGAADFDLELIDRRTLDENIQELVYRPTLHA
jgi:hypothetical protein